MPRPWKQLHVDEECLTDIKNLLTAQQRLQHQIELRMSEIMKGDTPSSNFDLDGQNLASPMLQTSPKKTPPAVIDTPAFREDSTGARSIGNVECSNSHHALNYAREQSRQVSKVVDSSDPRIVRLWQKISIKVLFLLPPEMPSKSKPLMATPGPTPTSTSFFSSLVWSEDDLKHDGPNKEDKKVFQLAEEFKREQLEREERRKQDNKPGWVQFIQSSKFDMFIGFVIVLNTISIAINLELQGYLVGDKVNGECGDACESKHSAAEAIDILEQVFIGIFLLEMILRLAANGLGLLFSPSHMLDFSIVIISIVDVWVLKPLNHTGSTASSFVVLRVVRVVKLARVFRVVRLLSFFGPLRVLVITIFKSGASLTWSMLLLCFFELIASIFLAQLVQSYLEDSNNPDDLRIAVWESFGTWSRSLWSAFEMTMAPGGFLQHRKLIYNLTPMIGIFIFMYQCLITFAVIRVITALFLKGTMDELGREETIQKQRIIGERKSFAETLRSNIDADGSGAIDFDEYSALVTIPQMQDWIEDAGLTDEAGRRLFFSLMDPRTKEMSFDHFLTILSWMGEPARTSDLLVMSYELHKVLAQTTHIFSLFGGTGGPSIFSNGSSA